MLMVWRSDMLILIYEGNGMLQDCSNYHSHTEAMVVGDGTKIKLNY